MYARKTGLAALGFALMLLTTPSYGQITPQIGSVGPAPNGAPVIYGPPHNVIYWPEYKQTDKAENDIGTSLISGCDPNQGPLGGGERVSPSGCYTDVILFSVFPDSSCNLDSLTNFGSIVQTGFLGNQVSALHSVGKTVLVSFGGAVDDPNSPLQPQNYSYCYYNNMSGLVNALVDFVTAWGFDGVDIDFEDSGALLATDSGSGRPPSGYDGIDFLSQLTAGLFNQLPSGQNIITHAPLANYWTQFANYTSDTGFYYQYPPYVQLWWNTGQRIAWFNTQFYNDGNLTTWQDISDRYQAIVNDWGVPPLLLVLGLPVTPAAAPSGGYLGSNDVRQLIATLQGQYQDQFGGVMGWSADNDDPANNDGFYWNVETWNIIKSEQRPWYAWFNVPNTGGCLTSWDGSSVSTDSCQAAQSQYWQFSANAIINTATGFCLDAGQPGLTLACNGTNYQNWQFFGNPNGGAMIVNRQTKECLDGGQSNLRFACNNGPWQSWWGGSE